MLFLLTGGVQTGKTRWLEQLLAELADDGVESQGVVAPGVWRRRDDEEASEDRPFGSGQGEYEKLGIDNVLLPGGERLPFARRRDLAKQEGTFDPASQSAAAQLVWEISDDAIARVNAHFDALGSRSYRREFSPALLVVDELGRLELEHGCGLTSALDLIGCGATACFPHAIVVVRAWLRDRAEERFAGAWGGAIAIEPGNVARDAVRAAFGLAPFIDNWYH